MATLKFGFQMKMKTLGMVFSVCHNGLSYPVLWVHIL